MNDEKPLKIVRLTAENVKKLVAVSIAPDGSLITVGGKNGAGKSSVLDAISWALGGEKLVPTEPIRAGETEAKIVVDLGDLVVTRKFARDRLLCDCATDAMKAVAPSANIEHAKTCNSLKFGETKSTLVVQNKDGAKYPSPQAVLDRLYGKIAFDPLQFARDEKGQTDTLQRLVGFDPAPFITRRKAAADERAMAKKTLAIKAAQILNLPHTEGIPDAEVSLDEISREMLDAETARRAADDAEREARAIEERRDNLNRESNSLIDQLRDLHAQVARLTEKQNALFSAGSAETGALTTAKSKADAMRTAIPDIAVIQDKLRRAENTNVLVRANKKHADAATDIAKVEQEIKQSDALVASIDAEREAALRAIAFPVPGLGLSDDGVTFGGIPLNQASTSEQMRVSVAIGLALNPKLRVLLVRNGNMLDSTSLAAVAAQAAEADAQVWVEWVSENGEGVGVMLEDGVVI